MANKFYTFMVIPERTSNVKKYVVPANVIRAALVATGALALIFIITIAFSITYLSKHEQYKQAFAKNQFLDNKLRELQSKVATTESTVARIQSFEQKLRVIANLDNTPKTTAAMGALTKTEMDASNGVNDSTEGYTGGSYAQSDFGGRTTGIDFRLEDLQVKATLQEQSLHDLYELLKGRQSELDATPTVWPVRGWVTSGFGYRVSPFTGGSQLHEGFDIAAKQGSLVYAPASGKVLAVDTSESFGKTILIEHGYGFVTMYGHNSEIYVKAGQKVKRGDLLCAVGMTGRSTGPHLHYQIMFNGVPVNPRKYILE